MRRNGILPRWRPELRRAHHWRLVQVIRRHPTLTSTRLAASTASRKVIATLQLATHHTLSRLRQFCDSHRFYHKRELGITSPRNATYSVTDAFSCHLTEFRPRFIRCADRER